MKNHLTLLATVAALSVSALNLQAAWDDRPTSGNSNGWVRDSSPSYNIESTAKPHTIVEGSNPVHYVIKESAPDRAPGSDNAPRAEFRYNREFRNREMACFEASIKIDSPTNRGIILQVKEDGSDAPNGGQFATIRIENRRLFVNIDGKKTTLKDPVTYGQYYKLFVMHNAYEGETTVWLDDNGYRNLGTDSVRKDSLRDDNRHFKNGMYNNKDGVTTTNGVWFRDIKIYYK
jgi:hypothetical protein